MREKYGYFKKNKRTRGIVLTVFACLVCLSAITFGVTSLNKKNNKKNETEDVVDLNNVKKNNTDNQNTNDSDEESEKKSDRKNTNAKNSEKDSDDDTQSDHNTESDDSTQLSDNTELSNDTASAGAKASQSYVYDDPDDIYGTVKINDRIEDAQDESIQDRDLQTENVADVAAMTTEYSFGKNNSVKWPVEGNVILDYSMDSTIYFPTLDSYKCNPAIIIQSENGTNVIAGVSGVVQEVSTNEEIGNYVVVGVGGGYEITYGQLKDIAVETGDRVEPDTSLGMVGSPTSYYKNEGDNVYFEIKKDGEPCDPLDFLE